MPFTAFKRHPMLMPGAILLAGVLMFPAFNIAYVAYATQRQNQEWCILLTDVAATNSTRVPRPGPGATPAQIAAYERWRIHVDVVELRARYGC